MLKSNRTEKIVADSMFAVHIWGPIRLDAEMTSLLQLRIALTVQCIYQDSRGTVSLLLEH